MHSLRVRPGRRYRLPESALGAGVTALERDLLLSLDNGGLILLRDLLTVEAMGEPPVLEFGAHDLSAQLIAALSLAHGGRAPLAALIACSRQLRGSRQGGVAAALAALRRDGLLPPAAPAEWDLP